MNVLMVAPAFPAEMPLFTRGLKRVGARVIGAGGESKEMLPEMTRAHLDAYIQVPSMADEAGAVAEVVAEVRRSGVTIDRVECQYELAMILAAKLREALGVPGMTVAETIPFRDKDEMKAALDRAGIRTPRHARAATAAMVREMAAEIGYPVIVKPIAGAGSMSTYRVDDAADLERVLPALRHVAEVSVEEFIDGEEFTFDTICAGGEVLFHNICMYRPRPLVSRTLEWVSPQTYVLREPDAPELGAGRTMGFAVLEALGFRDGFTHMEWHRTPDGNAVFGEIGARPPGARTVDTMNFASDVDLFTGWAEAVCTGRLSQTIERPYNAVQVVKRAQGHGRIYKVAGLKRLLTELGPAVVQVDLVRPGEMRRDWHNSLLSDGYLVLRHPDLATTIEMADRVATELQLFAG